MAARTVGDVLTSARRILQDAGTLSQRFSDADLLSAFNDGLAEVRRSRPDLFLGTTTGLRGEMEPFTTAQLASAFPLDWSYFDALVNWVVGRTEMRDDTYADTGRAAAFLGAFKARMQQP